MTKTIDVHDYSLTCAIRKIQRTIIENPKANKIIVIHGFNNGTVIKDALSNYKNIHNKRVYNTLVDPFNYGRTWIYLKCS